MFGNIKQGIYNLICPEKPGPLGQACPALRGAEAYGSAEIN